jgi:hypothetical protein
VIPSSALAQPVWPPLRLGPAGCSVVLLPRSERPSGSSANETTALGAVSQPLMLMFTQLRDLFGDFASALVLPGLLVVHD